MFATNATDRVILPANAPREAAAAGTVAAGVKAVSAVAVRNVTSVTDSVTLLAIVRTVLTVAIGVTVKVTLLKTATRAQTLRRATTATSRATLPVPVRRRPMIRTTGVSHSLATTATRWDTYRGTALRMPRHAMFATSLATSAVIVIRIVGSKPFLLHCEEECTSIWFWVFGIFKSWCCVSSQYLYPLDITTMQSDKALLGSNVHSPFLSGLH